MTDVPSIARGRVAAIVLAAGRSTRMGSPKPLLPFGGRTVIEHVVATLDEAGVGPIHVVVGHRGADVAAVLAGGPAVVVENAAYDLGMYSSLRTGIASLPETVAGTLLIPCDVPAVRAATFARVAAEGLVRGTIVHPTFRGEAGHPPFLPLALFAEIVGDDGEGGLRAVLARHEAEASTVAVFDRACLHDMDHPPEYAALAEALAHRHVPEPDECEAILEAQAVAEPIRRHCRAVAALAVDLARRLNGAGLALDVDLVGAGALLHDVAKGHARHAEVGAAILADLGFPCVASVIAQHMAIDFAPGDALDEAAVVHLADKRVAGERRVGLDERFAPAERRFGDDPAALAGARRRRVAAQALLRAVAARIDFADVPTPSASPPFVEIRIG